jgi:hypothetical protein
MLSRIFFYSISVNVSLADERGEFNDGVGLAENKEIDKYFV